MYAALRESWRAPVLVGQESPQVSERDLRHRLDLGVAFLAAGSR